MYLCVSCGLRRKIQKFTNGNAQNDVNYFFFFSHTILYFFFPPIRLIVPTFVHSCYSLIFISSEVIFRNFSPFFCGEGTSIICNEAILLSS